MRRRDLRVRESRIAPDDAAFALRAGAAGQSMPRCQRSHFIRRSAASRVAMRWKCAESSGCHQRSAVIRDSKTGQFGLPMATPSARMVAASPVTPTRIPQRWSSARLGCVWRSSPTACAVREREVARLAAEGHDAGRLAAAAALLDELVLSERFIEFLTLPAYEQLTAETAGTAA